MTPEEVYAALAAGKKVEYNRPSWDPNEWAPYNPIKHLDSGSAFRIAPTIIKYRRYFYKYANGVGVAAYTPTAEFIPIKVLEKSSLFVEWLDDDWVEAECPV